jgi:hypothetical protein
MADLVELGVDGRIVLQEVLGRTNRHLSFDRHGQQYKTGGGGGNGEIYRDTHTAKLSRKPNKLEERGLKTDGKVIS